MVFPVKAQRPGSSPSLQFPYGINNLPDDQTEQSYAENIQEHGKQLTRCRSGKKVAVAHGGHRRHNPVKGIEPVMKGTRLQHKGNSCTNRNKRQDNQPNGLFPQTHQLAGQTQQKMHRLK
ncbi:hypothetical protein D3C75_1055020 [compost metagenome]